MKLLSAKQASSILDIKPWQLKDLEKQGSLTPAKKFPKSFYPQDVYDLVGALPEMDNEPRGAVSQVLVYALVVLFVPAVYGAFVLLTSSESGLQGMYFLGRWALYLELGLSAWMVASASYYPKLATIVGALSTLGCLAVFFVGGVYFDKLYETRREFVVKAIDNQLVFDKTKFCPVVHDRFDIAANELKLQAKALPGSALGSKRGFKQIAIDYQYKLDSQALAGVDLRVALECAR